MSNLKIADPREYYNRMYKSHQATDVDTISDRSLTHSEKMAMINRMSFNAKSRESLEEDNQAQIISKFKTREITSPFSDKQN